MPLVPGCIIKRRLKGSYTRYTWLVGIRWHMGIYIGSDQVIHFNGEKTSTTAVICKESLQTFACGETIWLHARPKDERHGEAICAKAERIYNERSNVYNHNYSFAFNNCEDFSAACFKVRYV